MGDISKSRAWQLVLSSASSSRKTVPCDSNVSTPVLDVANCSGCSVAQDTARNGCALRRDISWMRCAIACFPAPSSPRSSTGTSLSASSRMTASTARILGLIPSTKTNRDGSMKAVAPSLLLTDSGKSLPMFYPLWRQTILSFALTSLRARLLPHSSFGKPDYRDHSMTCFQWFRKKKPNPGSTRYQR